MHSKDICRTSRRQRGIVQGWLLLIGVIVILGLIGGIAYQVKSTIADADKHGYDRGVEETTAAYAKRDNAALAAANIRINELQEAARKREREHAAQLNDISGQYQQEVGNANRKVADLTRRVRAGDLRLRDPGAVCAAQGGGGRVPEASGSAGGRDGGTGTELSAATAEFLISEANRADDVARQLAACQAVVRADRK